MFGSKVNKLGASKQNLFEPDRLFRDSEEGIYNDITTWPTSYFEDTAGTDAAELEDTVALILDQSGNGNDWSQATAGARGKVSARYNLLERTEEFNDAYWPKQNLTVTENATTAPDGTMTADLLYPTTSGSARRILLNVSGSVLPGVNYKVSVFVKSAGFQWVSFLNIDVSSTLDDCWFDIVNGDVGTSGARATGAVEAVGDGWFKIKVTGPSDPTSGGFTNYFSIVLADNNGSYTATADGTSGIYLWGADLRLASDTDQPAYQRVTTATDYDSVGFDPYLLMDRVDDNYTATLAAGTYTVAIGTRQGIWIDTVEHAGGTFTFGPTTYTGGPAGLLSVIGDKLIGPPTLVNRVLTTSEKNALVQWYQARGAGALYDSSAISWDSATDTYGGIYA